MTGSDPADPGSWNKYAYVGGDPINFRDTAGTCKFNSSSGDEIPDTCQGGVFGGGPPVGQPQGPSRLDPPSWVTEWESLSEDCQKGLRSKFGPVATIQGMTAAVDRANAQMSVLQAAADAAGIDPALLAAIGIQESGFRGGDQSNGLGKGRFPD